MTGNPPLVYVACGVLQDAATRVLLAQRPPGKAAQGYWEFPGGKIEPNESPRIALERELKEELGIAVIQARPLMRFRHEYTARTVVLDTWLVLEYQGTPYGREGQAIQWCLPQSLDAVTPLLPTVAPIARACRLPEHYVFTPPEMILVDAIEGLHRLPGNSLLRLRVPRLSDQEYAEWAYTLAAETRRYGIALILDRSPSMVAAVGAAGWHATDAQRATYPRRPLASTFWCLTSCHDTDSLRHAHALGFDAAVLGSVYPTATHPGATTLGWSGFAAVRGDIAMPVYAIGGVDPSMRDYAYAAYAQGFAGISAYWPSY
jgi:8-oxo-dGTP diphosphatase